MLDATDTETVSTAITANGMHDRRPEAQKVAIDAGNGTTPRIAASTRATKRTGKTLTEARSKIRK